jgi:hypothetical protein
VLNPDLAWIVLAFIIFFVPASVAMSVFVATRAAKQTPIRRWLPIVTAGATITVNIVVLVMTLRRDVWMIGLVIYCASLACGIACALVLLRAKLRQYRWLDHYFADLDELLAELDPRKMP